MSYTSYWDDLGTIDPETGELIPGESGTEIGYYDWTIIKLTDKEFICTFDDEGNTMTVTGTR